MGMSNGVHAKYEALVPEERCQVYAIFAPDLALGWVPKESDIEAAISLVEGLRQPGPS